MVTIEINFCSIKTKKPASKTEAGLNITIL